jgi:hypothetical protein
VGGFFEINFLSLSQHLLPLTKSPPHGILKGGTYGSKEESQEESQKEKKVTKF